MTSQPTTQRHPVAAFAAAAVARLDTLATTPVWSMASTEQLDTLRLLAVAEAQVSALRLRVLAEADRSEAAASTGAATAADWVAVQTRQVRREARSDLKLAQAVERRPTLTRGCSTGAVNTAQARAITTALYRLPTTGRFALTPDQEVAAEEHLVGLAAHHDAADLAILGRRVLEVVAPEVVESYEGRILEQQEALALRRTTLTLREDDEGTCYGRFRIPTLHGHVLRKMILALASPTRPVHPDVTDQTDGVDGVARSLRGSASGGIDPDLPTEVRHGIALTQLLETIGATELPRTGGCGATVVVTMTLEQLTADLDRAGVATLDTGAHLSASEARRLACTAGIVPAVLGGPSQVLDVGRRRRFHTEAMRIAMGVRDGGCTAQGCNAPPGLCHAHHDIPWSRGGPTDSDHGRLLCGHHHRRLHDPAYLTTHLPGGKVAFHRRE